MVDDLPSAFSRPYPPTAVLCDLGKVLVDFDRSRLPQRFAEVFNRPFPTGCEKQLGEYRAGFESGDLGGNAFAQSCLELLGLNPEDREVFQKIWPSIFTVIPETVAHLRTFVARPNTTLVVVSDTDPWRERACARDFGLEDLMADAVCSYQADVRPKWEDSSMWEKARAIAEARLGQSADRVIAIDDLELHTRRALECGAATHVHLHTTPESLEIFLAGLNQ
jgi:FMN phosphatase YigB (HAD superfamily)